MEGSTASDDTSYALDDRARSVLATRRAADEAGAREERTGDRYEKLRYSLLVCRAAGAARAGACAVRRKSRVGESSSGICRAMSRYAVGARSESARERMRAIASRCARCTRERLETVKLTERRAADPLRVGRRRHSGRHTSTSLRKALDDLRDRRNVRLHLVGHADDQPLSAAARARLRRQRGSVARARRRSRGVPAERAWRCRPKRSRTSGPATRGRSRSNATPEGRAHEPPRRSRGLVRRAQGDASPKKKCSLRRTSSGSRSAAWRPSARCASRKVRRGARACESRAAAALRRGHDGSLGELRRAHPARRCDNMQDKQNVLVKLIGYTDDAPLTERNERIYGNHARALEGARASRGARACRKH